MCPAKPAYGLKSFSWTCCGLILSFDDEITFYKNLDRKRKYANCDITQSERLWKDYQIIEKYLPYECVI